MERDRVGLNLGSMLPWSAVPVVGLLIADWMTRRSGYAFWQALPFRSVTVDGLKRTGIPVRFAEPAWNATTFRAHFRHELGAEGMHTKLQDPLFFWDPKKCERLFNQFFWKTEAELILHHLTIPRWPGSPLEMSWLERSLVEVHPGLKRSAADLVAAVADGMVPQKPYVIDLRHLRRSDDDGFNLGPWQEALETLLPFTNLVHVQAIDGEWQNFINGKPTELAEMLRFVRNWGYAGPFVVEYKPMTAGFGELVSPILLVKSLIKVRERVEELT